MHREICLKKKILLPYQSFARLGAGVCPIMLNFSSPDYNSSIKRKQTLLPEENSPDQLSIFGIFFFLKYLSLDWGYYI